MKLSRLEIYGFKSFAKKLDLALTGGITVVVGPNGCGKTNVVDSIRWVLGEQRPTQIRLERMEDVLFKGSATRHQLGMCEVSLTIENISGILPLNVPEITITRRLFRSGESDYMINRKPCRLADINDMLMDTGMGTDSYSLFELSMINAILSDKTDDRRHIFEEAAGVTKYKARRKSALNKLISIEDDLNRVGDIVTELQRRVDSLKRQAAKAKRYRMLKSEMKSKTIAIASYELDKRKNKIAGITHDLENVQATTESLRVKIASATSDSERLSTDILGMEKELEETAVSFNSGVEMISEKEKELARLDSRLESLNEIADRAREAAKRNSTALEKLAENHGSCAGNLSDVTEQLEGNETSLIEAEKLFNEVTIKATEKTDTWTSLENEYRRLEREIASGKAELGKSTALHEGKERRLGEISSRLDELGTSLIALNKELEQLQEQTLYHIQGERALSKKLTSMKKSLDEYTDELEMVDSRLRIELEKQAGLKAERDFLTEVIRSFEGYSEGVRTAAQAEFLKGRVLGVLADLISSDERYVFAVETALRENLQTILVESTDDAVSGARYLSGEKKGHATFLPLDSIGETARHQSPYSGVRSPDTEDNRLRAGNGIIGPVHEFVRTEARFMPVVRRLFDKVIIVDTLETAVELHKQHSDLQFVALNGEMIGSYGDIHGGRIHDKGNASIGRGEKLNNITASLEEIDNEVHILQQKRSELTEKIALLRGLIGEVENTVDNARKKYSELSSSEARISSKKESVMEAIENLTAETNKIKESFARDESETKRLTEQINAGITIIARLEERREKTGLELNNLKAELEMRRSAVNACQVECAILTEKKASLERELETIRERRETLAQSSSRSQTEIENAENEILEVGIQKKNTLNELEILERNHKALKNKKDEIERHFADLRSKRSEKEHELQTHRRELDEISRKESSLTLARDEAAMVMNNIRERLSEEYFIDPEDIPSGFGEREFDPENEKLLLDDLRRKIQALGDVNLAAEADYNEEKKRLDFLEHERNDLIDAGNTLKDTITKINQIARARFMETFEKIRINFQTMFQEFFEGGVCDISLEENIDTLEAGILITARPPGKNVRSITLLSSGERALTAISLLFAIYLVKPSPYCILDEVDAPLDDANIDRYLKVIKEFSHKTQFIMVTHNKKTMAAADNLYGITMEEPGLSSLVSVRLSEAASDEHNGGGKRLQKEEAIAV